MWIKKLEEKREKKMEAEFTKAGILRYFHYDYGNMRTGQTGYTLSEENGEIHLIRQITSMENGKEEREDYMLPVTVMNEIKSVIRNEKIYLWNGFHKSNSVMMNEHSFSMKLEFDHYTLSASGIVMKPVGYDNGHKALEEILENIVNRISSAKSVNKEGNICE